jgi:enoyl-CoA hydratase
LNQEASVPVDLERRGAVAIVTLNRPEALNAISPETFDELDARLDEIEDDDAIRAVVLTGAGEKAFAAGADIKHMGTATAAEARAFAAKGHAITRRIEDFPKPVIAAVNGFALGGGCELALSCDIRLASENARFGQPEVNLGIPPGWGGTQRLARTTNLGIAKELILTGRQVKAEEAKAIGLVNHVYPLAELIDKAVELGETIAAKSPAAVAQAKRLTNLALGGDAHGRLTQELDAFALAFTTDDQREGMAAFFEKRSPNFTGR